MTPTDMRAELGAIEKRTRKLLGTSAVIHAVLIVWLVLLHAFTTESQTLTEITWIEPEEVQVAAAPKVEAAEPPRAPAVSTKQPSRERTTENIQRKPDVAEIAPEPQTLHALDNTISERLLSLQRREHEKPAPIASINTPNPVSKPKLAGVDTRLSRPKAESLVRREGTASTPIELSRSKSRVMRADVLVAPPMADKPTRAPAQQSDASRELAGARMTGPVADRPIVSYESPNYPEWAKIEGVEGSVMIYFVVLANGRVKENVMVQRTSGFADFDQNAVSAILAWRFERLGAGKTGEQWGTILFHYRLRSAN